MIPDASWCPPIDTHQHTNHVVGQVPKRLPVMSAQSCFFAITMLEGPPAFYHKLLQYTLIYSPLQYPLEQPPTIHSKIQPPAIHPYLQPLTIHSYIQPPTVHSYIQPPTIHSYIQPPTIPPMYKPLQYTPLHMILQCATGSWKLQKSLWTSCRCCSWR
jgi:hypothetical protein